MIWLLLAAWALGAWLAWFYALVLAVGGSVKVYPTRHLCIEAVADPALEVSGFIGGGALDASLCGFGLAIFRCWCGNHANCK